MRQEVGFRIILCYTVQLLTQRCCETATSKVVSAPSTRVSRASQHPARGFHMVAQSNPHVGSTWRCTSRACVTVLYSAELCLNRSRKTLRPNSHMKWPSLMSCGGSDDLTIKMLLLFNYTSYQCHLYSCCAVSFA